MALEQIVKELQAQNTQFQAMILSLTKRQEEMKALITKDMKRENPADIKDDQWEQL